MAGSKKDAFETAILQLIFNNTNLANIGDSTGLRGSSTAGNFYIALFKDGTEPSDSAQGTECDYTGYARKDVVRSSGGWTVASGACSNTAAITFAQCTAGSNTAGAFAICKADVEGVNDAIYWGELTSPLAISSGITPEFAAGDLDVTED
jgi:hypothetical protein